MPDESMPVLQAAADQPRELHGAMTTLGDHAARLEPRLGVVVKAIAHCVEEIGTVLRDGGAASTSEAGTANTFGDKQLQVDVQADEIVFRHLKDCGAVETASSEEQSDIHRLEGSGYSVAFDPLDGSSIIGADFAVGSIFGVWPGSNLLTTGREQVAALYSVYGPRTILVMAAPVPGAPDKRTVSEFVLCGKEWQLVRSDITIGEKKIFAPANLRASVENTAYRELVMQWMAEKYTLRYTGGMVPDVHHILAKGGGVFCSPIAPSAPAKLRLLYECAPLACIVEAAGGQAIDNQGHTLDHPISSSNVRAPICLGSKSEGSEARMQGGFGFGQGAFGQTSQPFGQAAPSPFGQPASPFGQQAQPQSTPFGATTSTGMFGAQAQPAFGASAPAFGAASTPAFGAGAFGAKPATPAFGFGATPAFGASQPAFGAASTPAFGAASTPAFGAASAPAFGASPFSSSGFGASTPAFGASSTPAFGAAPATPTFGASPGAFGTPGTGFGATPSPFGGSAAPSGTRLVPFRKVQDQDSSTTAGGAKTLVYFNTITAMPEYQSKSLEELRWEDYQAGVKGNTTLQQPHQQGAFGQAGSPFGTPQPAAASPFGGTPAFGGASTPAFGAPSTPAFGAASTPAFGTAFGSSMPAFGAASTPAFGAASTPAFGTTTSAFGSTSTAFGNAPGAFGTPASAAPFGQSSPSLFGTPQSTPAFGAAGGAFGGFGTAASTPAFGQASAPAFGAAPFGQTSAPAFGQTSAPAFGQASTPAFSFSSASAFGTPASAPSMFGATSAPAFGTGATSSAFGTGMFGAQASRPFGSTPMFGGSTPAFNLQMSAPAFGTPQSSAGGIFGGNAPAFGTGMFGGQTQASAFSNMFAPASQQQQALTMQQPIAQPAGVTSSPYGTLPEPPQINVPEYRVGLSQRPAASATPPRPVALITPRSITPRSAVRPRAPRRSVLSRTSPAPAGFTSSNGSEKAAGTSDNVFVARENPRAFFVRAPLPSTESAATASPSPSMGATPQRSGGGHDRDRERQRSQFAEPSHSSGGEHESEGRHDAEKNGRTPRSAENGHARRSRTLTDEEISEQLPRVEQADYGTQPTASQLAAMARDDPASLAQVANFTVMRRGVGAVRWLDPVDVRGLDINAIVRLTKGSVEVYLDEKDKPDVGDGLNQAAEVTLYKVFKMDKATGKPTADPDAIKKFVKKLQKLASDQSARFLGYEAEGGIWRFEVEHFSKYGLVDSESDDEDMPRGAVRQDQGVPPASARPPAERQGMASEGADERGEAGEEAGEGMQESDDAGLDSYSERDVEVAAVSEDGMEDAAEAEPEVERVPLSPVLQLALPAHLNLDPQALAAMRDTFYPQPGSRAPHKMRKVMRPALADQAAHTEAAFTLDAASDRRSSALVGDVAPQAAGAAGQPSPPARAVTAWQRAQPALQPPSGLATQALGRTATPPPALPLALSPHGAPSPPSLPLVAASARQAPEASERCLVDAGLLMGRSFRVGWGPNGAFAHPGLGSGRGPTPASRIVLEQVLVNSRLLPAAGEQAAIVEMGERVRERCRSALQLHVDHSVPDAGLPTADAEPGEANEEASSVVAQPLWRDGWQPGVPRWSLKCERRQELQHLCSQLIRQGDAFFQKHEAQLTRLEELCVGHAKWTWELVHVLFAFIEGEEDGAMQRDDMDQDQEAQPGSERLDADGEPLPEDGVEDEDMTAELRIRAHRLAVMKRRAALSRWLKERAWPEVEAVVRQQGSPLGRVAQLMSGHQVAAAAGLAAAAGDVRMASLISQAGYRSDCRADVEAQLSLWEATGFLSHISGERKRIYHLLAGAVDGVTADLDLDWRRALGLQLWYAHGPTGSIADAVRTYTQAANLRLAAAPVPLYAEGELDGDQSGRAADINYHLLQLFTRDLDPRDGQALAQLLRPAAYTPDPLDYGLGWQVLGVLQAIHQLSLPAQAPVQVYMLHTSFIAQLESIGGLAEWCVYVALHLPDSPLPDWRGLREQLVRELLMRHAPAWASASPAHAARRAFLRDRLGVPAAWLAESLALYARYKGDVEEEWQQLVEACEWATAHTLLCRRLAPKLFLAGTEGQARLRKHLSALQPHDAALASPGSSLTWATGAGVYAAYFQLQDVYEGQQEVEGAASPAQRMTACRRFSEQLWEAVLLHEDEKDVDHQVVFSRMAEHLARWLLEDGSIAVEDVANRESMIVNVESLDAAPRVAHLQVAAANLGAVMA
ncbi:hypothetical protein WJX72_008858 [[Myrmecia] bisecta]|uniref:fructose-bisphosphatase n=1 Tax=[Myrmecia] bisecta TaxID=41462 RepID=A0AAW1R8T4_9CHLO